MTGYIYKITNLLNGMVYIGQTIQTVEIRWRVHQSQKSCCTYLKNAINNYGVQNFSVEAVHTIEAEHKIALIEKLNEIENEYILKFNSMVPTGYNLIRGGRSATRSKASKPRLGRKRSPQEIAKMVLTKTGMKYRPMSEIGKQHNAEAHWKSVHAQETGQTWP